MATIKEDYISFETAKLLKKKGFDDIGCECHGWIGRSGKHYSTDDTFYDDKELKKAQEDRKDFIPLITLQMAMKWLREIHKLDIDVSIEYKNSKKVYYYSILKKTVIRDIDCLHSETNFDSYEVACETAIKYCLENLI